MSRSRCAFGQLVKEAQPDGGILEIRQHRGRTDLLQLSATAPLRDTTGSATHSDSADPCNGLAAVSPGSFILRTRFALLSRHYCLSLLTSLRGAADKDPHMSAVDGNSHAAH